MTNIDPTGILRVVLQRRRTARRARRENAILGALYTHDTLGGYELIHHTGLRSGALYPALRRLEERGLVVGQWEPPRADGVPERRLYQLADFAPEPRATRGMHAPRYQYRCPNCGRWGEWTDGTSTDAGDEHDEYWCQICGAQTPLQQCEQRVHQADLAQINSGSGWYEVANPRTATTCIAYVYEDGSVYFPEGEQVLNREEFEFAAARGRAHRLARADDSARVGRSAWTAPHRLARADDPDLRRSATAPCPTCTWPRRDTVGMVCQTCGTDYGTTAGHDAASTVAHSRSEQPNETPNGQPGACPHCPDGHTPPWRGSQPWLARVGSRLDEDGQPLEIIVERSGLAHVAESDAAWVFQTLNRPQAGRCGKTGPELIHPPGSRHRSLCALPAGHAGWHRDDDGQEWSEP